MTQQQQQAGHPGRSAVQRPRWTHELLAGTSAAEMLRVLPIPCMFTDVAGRCIDRNQAFSRAVEQLSLRLVVGRVRFSNPQLQTTWETALSETHATALGQIIVATAASGRQWQVHLIPLHALAREGGDALEQKMIMAVFEEKAVEVQPAPQSLPSTARLTPAEHEVLAALLQGLSAKSIASLRGASINTVRSQIMAILDKTGHNSQRELIASFGASSFGASSSFGVSSFRAGSSEASSFPAGDLASQR
jgi:DNA-binding CsgD family transcriptional regulator